MHLESGLGGRSDVSPENGTRLGGSGGRGHEEESDVPICGDVLVHGTQLLSWTGASYRDKNIAGYSQPAQAFMANPLGSQCGP